MGSLLVYYNSLILLNALLVSASLVVSIPTAFRAKSPPGVDIIQFLYSAVVMVVSYGSILYQSCLSGDTRVKRAKMIYAIERVLTAQIFACLLNSIAVTYRASFLSYQPISVLAFVLSWLATIFAGLGRYMFPRHPSLKFEAAKKFVEDDEPLPEAEEQTREDIEMMTKQKPLPVLPRLPEAAHSRWSLH